MASLQLMVAGVLTCWALSPGASAQPRSAPEATKYQGTWVSEEENSATKEKRFEIVVDNENAVTRYTYEWAMSCGGAYAGARQMWDYSRKPQPLTGNKFETTDYISSGPCKGGKAVIVAEFREKEATATVKLTALGATEPKVTTWKISRVKGP